MCSLLGGSTHSGTDAVCSVRLWHVMLFSCNDAAYVGRWIGSMHELARLYGPMFLMDNDLEQS